MLIGWPLAAAFGVLAAAVGATVVGIGPALRMLSSMPAVARLGRAVEPDDRQPAWLWRC